MYRKTVFIFTTRTSSGELEVPAIPESLVALMGLSLATRATIFITEQEKRPEKETPEEKEARLRKEEARKSITPRLRDLIRSGQESGNPVAITKAQMLFWTCIAGVLFFVKSLLNGVLWEVPWQLVTLMGISQVSYVIPPLHEKLQKDSPPTRVQNKGTTTQSSEGQGATSQST